MSRKLSLAHLTVAELSPPEAVLVAAKAGYDMVDLRLLPLVPGDRTYDLSPHSAVINETISCLKDTGLTVFDIEQIRLTRELDVGGLETFFETAARLGARRIKVAGIDPDLSAVADKMALVCERVKFLDIVVDIEFMMWSSVKSITDANRVVNATGSTNAGILVDALHLSRSGGTPEQVRDIDPGRFGYMHMCDAPRTPPPNVSAMLHEARSLRELPGEGGLPLIPLLRALPPGLPISVELGLRDRGLDADTRAALGIFSTRVVISEADSLAAAQAQSR